MNFRTKSFFGIAICVALAGCQIDPEASQPIESYPPEVVAALPPGVPPSIVFKTGEGCYAYSIEQNSPLTGFPLMDRAGNPICEK